MTDYATATDFEHLLASSYKCERAVLWKESVSSYSLNGLERTLKLEQELKDGTYKPMPTRLVRITHPKPREAISTAFRDRVYQRSLNDNIVYPAMTNGLIYDNGACQKGKGVDFQRSRIKCHMQRYFRKHGMDGFVVQCDIKQYYKSIVHESAENSMRRYLDEVTAEKVCEILRYQYSGEVGYNPGSQMVQIIGISLLNPLDHHAKETEGINHYWRYVDDFISICPTKEVAEAIKSSLGKVLSEYGLTLHETKTRIYRLRDGIETLGFRFRLTSTGKVIMTVPGKKIKDARRKYRRMAKRVREGTMNRSTVDQSWECFMSHLEHGDTYNLRRKLNEFYKGLWKSS